MEVPSKSHPTAPISSARGTSPALRMLATCNRGRPTQQTVSRVRTGLCSSTRYEAAAPGCTLTTSTAAGKSSTPPTRASAASTFG
eukprot:12934274-Prorocentrum_lima.AAC.1